MSSIRSEVGRTSLINVVGYAVRIAVSFLTTVLISRWLGPEEFGDASLIISSVAFFLYLFTCGFDHTLIFFVSRFLSDGRPSYAKNALQVGIATCALISALTLGIVITFLRPVLEIAQRPYLFWPTVIFLSQMPIAALGYIYGGFLRGAKEFTPVILKDQIIIPVAGLIGAVIFTKIFQFGLYGYGYAQLFSYVIGIAYIYGQYLSTKGLTRSRNQTTEPVSQGPKPKDLILFSLPVGIGSALEPLVTHSCVMAAGFFLASSDIGRFSVCLRIALFAQLFLQAIVPVFAPFFSELAKMGQAEELRNLHHNVQYWCAKWALLFTSATLFYGDLVLSAFGSQYSGSTPILWGLIAGCAIEGAFASTRQSLVMVGRNFLNMANFLFVIALNIIMTSLLCPKYGVWGLVISYSASYFVLNLVRCFEFWLISGVTPLSHKQARVLISYMLFTGLMYFGYQELPSASPLRTVSSIVVLSASFLVLFWNDRDLLRGVLRKRLPKS